jgi:uncharacterized membrane protein
LAIFFLFPSKKFLQISLKFSCWKILPKNRRNKEGTKLDVSFSDVFSLPKQEWQKSPAGTRQTYGKSYVWFGEIERKLAKLSKTTFTYCSSS